MATTVISTGFSAQQLGETTAKWVQRITQDVALDALRAEVGKGFDNEPVVITDGVTRRDPAQVKPYGKIEFVARQNYADIVLWAMNELWKRSPILTRRYINSHVVMINGVSLGANQTAALRAAKPGDRIQIVNTQPYARKLEGATASGKTGRSRRKGTSRQAPNGVYRAVLQSLVQRYGKSIFIDFTYVKLNLGVKVWGDQGGGTFKRKGKWVKLKATKRVLRDQVYPALKLFIRPVDLGATVH